MIRTFLATLAVLLPLTAHAQEEQQSLVDRATLTVQDIMSGSSGKDPQSVLQSAHAVMVCPQVFRAAFIFGGSGGGCVLAARDANGTWSYPAFYGIGSGSAGFQVGIQDLQVIMMILTRKGLSSVLDDQFRFGGDAGIAVATVGAGIEGATTGALGADIVVVALARGLFAGISLQGSVMTPRTAWNQAYYGRDFAGRNIVIDMQARNPGADPLREVLTRFGGTGPKAPPAAQASAARNGLAPAPAAPITPQPLTSSAPLAAPSRAPVLQQSLPPPKS